MAPIKSLPGQTNARTNVHARSHFSGVLEFVKLVLIVVVHVSLQGHFKSKFLIVIPIQWLPLNDGTHL